MNTAAILISLATSISTSLIISKKASSLGISKTNTTGERFASQSKPIFGGFIFAVGLIACIATLFFTENQTTETLLIALPLLVAFLSGLLDDIRNTPPGFKFITQIATGVIIYASGICPSFYNNEYANLFLCVFWTVALMNSLNMLDNMDAITTSVSIAILLSIITASLLLAVKTEFLSISISFAIALCIFLASNWHPSSMYMGDNGSQFVGALIAIITLHFYAPSVPATTFETKPLLGLLLSLSIPFTDTATVSINRLLQGKSPFVGDKNHTTHNLYYLGFSIPRVGLIFIIATAITNAIAIAIAYNLLNSIAQETVAICVCFVICAGFYLTTKLKKETVSNQRGN